MPAPILVPLDGSKLAERALTLALPLAEQRGAPLLLFHAHVPVLPLTVGGLAPVRDAELDERWLQDSRTYIVRLARRIANLTASPVESVHREGKVVASLRAVVEERGVGLIVMSTHGRGGFQRFWLGGVADAVVREAMVPVLLVRGARPPAKRLAGQPPFTHALVPLDGSGRAESAIAEAKALLGHTPSRLSLVHVVHPMSAVASAHLDRDHRQEVVREYLEPLARRLASATLEVRIDVKVDANVARVLLAAVREHEADVIVIAGQGMSGIQRMVVGSVADRLIRTAPVPVLVVPTEEADATIQG